MKGTGAGNGKSGKGGYNRSETYRDESENVVTGMQLKWYAIVQFGSRQTLQSAMGVEKEERTEYCKLVVTVKTE